MSDIQGNLIRSTVIDQYSCVSWCIPTHSQERILNSPNFFHKFIISNGNNYKPQVILDALIRQVFPYELIITKYESSKGCLSFLANQCAEAIRILCISSMKVNLPDKQMLQVTIILHFKEATEDSRDYNELNKVNKERYNIVAKTLDLSYYSIDPDFQSSYYPIWVPSICKLVLSSIRKYTLVKVINLSHNKLTTLEHLHPLSSLSKLSTLDVSNNKLHWEGFRSIPRLRLREIILDGNPLCDTSPDEYMKRVKQVLPTVEMLDFTDISAVDMCLPVRTCLMHKKCASLVDQFLHHYFNWFQGADRAVLAIMYHPQAAVSLSIRHIPDQVTTSTSKIMNFKEFSRNILKISDYWKAADSFRQGRQKVIYLLTMLPEVIVDRKSVTVDVPYFVEGEMVQINTMGVMRDCFMNNYCFDFSFILKPNPDNQGEWHIVNHLMAITNATSSQAQKTFFQDDPDHVLKDPFELTKEEKLMTLQELSTMNSTSCESFLEDSLWNLEQALQSFVDLYKAGLLPPENFEIAAKESDYLN